MEHTIDQDSGFIFPEAQDNRELIKVIGVGGGGGNAVNHLYQQDVKGVTFGMINTDNQALRQSPIPMKIVMGGRGAGGKPEVAKHAAEQCKEAIETMLDDGTKMVFITASMGGGTGTGAGPVVARLAHDMGLLTVAIVNTPFNFEGQNKMKMALEGIRQMQQHVDAMIIINNQRLVENYEDLPMSKCFALADDVLAQAACAISNLISIDGYWNIDFNDVRSTLQEARAAIISEGTGEGEHRVTKALNAALDSPLLRNRNIYDATRLLINIYCNPDAENPLVAREVRELEDFKRKFRKEDSQITGWTYDRNMGEEVKITILASGFDINLDEEGENDIILLDPNDDEPQLDIIENTPTYQRGLQSFFSETKPKKTKEKISFD
ncbi:MAG: cell division protein FtsZ [Muribaculaceae bacterium]|nr:cell division protein FtsZ [Muribaculaceae bacterium]